MEKDKKTYILNVIVDTLDGPEEYELDISKMPLEDLAELLDAYPQFAEIYYTRLFEEGPKKA